MNVRKLKKLKKLNSVEGQIRKLRFTVMVMLNFEFSCFKSTFSTKMCDQYFKWLKKKLFSHKNFENPCSKKKVPNWHLSKNSHRDSTIVAIFQEVPIWHFFPTAWIFKIFVAKQLLFKPFKILITDFR